MTFWTLYVFSGIFCRDTNFLVATGTVELDYVGLVLLALFLLFQHACGLATFGTPDGFAAVVLRHPDFLTAAGTVKTNHSLYLPLCNCFKANVAEGPPANP